MPRPKGPLPNQCGAKTRAGHPCTKAPIKGKKRCKNHGGNSTGPPPGKMKGNKNRVTHGLHEHIAFDTLTEEELALVGNINVAVVAQIDGQIKLVDIRIRRMMGRIKKLQESEFTIIEMKKEDGFGAEGPIDKQTIISAATLGQIQQIEDGITKLHEKQAKLLDLKHKIESDGDNEDDDANGSLDSLSAAIREGMRLMKEAH